MILRDFHVHTNFCDGTDSAEDIVQAAISRGMTHIGFSGHSHTPCDESYCMSREGTREYVREIERLKVKYAGKIRIYCGTEQDFFSDMPTDGLDYVIGSVHYIEAGGEIFPIDESAEILKEAAKKHFGGDFYKLAERYFETVVKIPEKTNADIIGHFDLIAKFNEKNALFDETDPRYLKIAERAADRLIEKGAVFEINTGAIARGLRKEAYPLPLMLEYILENGGRTILSSDSHRKEDLCFGFEEYERFEMPPSFLMSLSG